MYNNIYSILYTHQFKNSNVAKFYLDRYIKFIESRKNRILTEETYTEKHHIVPRSWIKSEELKYLLKDENNLIKLTAREHFIAHLILYHTKDKSMTRAMWQMINRVEVKNDNSRLYEQCKLKIAEFMRNRVVSEETRRKMSSSKKGKILSEEQKEKLRKKMLGRVLTEEWKRKISESNKGNRNSLGHHHTKETIEKIRLANTGYKHTEEAKRKMSISKKGTPCPTRKKVICLETNKIFKSGYAASLFLGLSKKAISQSIIRKQKCGGYTWKYLD